MLDKRNHIFFSLRKLIENGRIKQVLNILVEGVGKDHQKVAILLKSRFSEIRTRKMTQQASDKDLLSELNRLNGDTLDFIQDLEDEKVRLIIGKADFPYKELGSGDEGNLLDTVRGYEFEMVFVNGGPLSIGTLDLENNTGPIATRDYNIFLGDYLISKYPVTQSLWCLVTGDSPNQMRENDCTECPIGGVSVNDVEDRFIPNLNRLTGRQYRLPTEAEWEFAAKGGIESKGYFYSGSEELSEVGWFEGNSGRKAHPVGRLKPNELGIYDMCGNVWELVQDSWHEYFEDAPKNGDPYTLKNSSHGIRRGGSWNFEEDFCTTKFRLSSFHGYRPPDIGFRLALSPHFIFPDL